MTGLWYAARTAPNGEMTAVLSMTGVGFVPFCPMVRRFTRHARRRRVVERALLSRYVFVHVAPTQCVYDLRRVRGVEGVVGIAGRPIPIPDALLEHLMEADMEGRYDETNVRDMPRRGDAVRVRDLGLTAIVDRVVSEGNIRVILDAIIGGSSTATVSLDRLSPCRDIAT